jgi:hypothetical protein
MNRPLFGDRIDIKQIRALILIGDVLLSINEYKLLPLSEDLIRLIRLRGVQIFHASSSGVIKLEDGTSVLGDRTDKIDSVCAIKKSQKTPI